MGAEPDFGGYATKANLKCSDGRTITPDAFKHQDRETVPLVWQHARNEPSNVLGHAVLEHREDGIYCLGFFNDTAKGKDAKILVQHNDVKSLSIMANNLIEKSKVVMHGMIREVSLVLAGANPGARIDFVRLQHADGTEDELDDEAVITADLPLEHTGVKDEPVDTPKEESVVDETKDVEHAEDGKTVKDVFETLSDEQKNVVYYLIGQAASGTTPDKAEHSDESGDGASVQSVLETLNDEQKNVVHYMIGEALEHAGKTSEDSEIDTADDNDGDNTAAHADNKEGNIVTNVFEQNAAAAGKTSTGTSLTHAQQQEIFKIAKDREIKLSSAVAIYAAENSLEHGIDSIDILFPDAKAITTSPDFIKRRTEWVDDVLTNTRHVPFAKIKSLTANLTMDAARAKGYIKGSLKKEEFFPVAKRETGPQTIYKKQKLDRDDILDITDFDVVAWLKGEMRLMLEEELARAILIGDGRDVADEDKIKEDRIRPIATDNELFVTTLNVNLGDASSSADEVIDLVTRYRGNYRGSGTPTFYTSETMLANLLLIKDTTGRRIYRDLADLAAALRVSKIVPVEVLEDNTISVIGIIVNLQDYVVGANRGGDISLFDDFDIDYNQYKYLIETRVSGALVKAKSALVIKQTANNAVVAVPVAPAWNGTTHQVTVPTTTGVVYKNEDTGATLTTGSPVTLTAGQTLRVEAEAAAGYYLPSDAADEYLFDYTKGRINAGLV